jgi:tight adherence protein C
MTPTIAALGAGTGLGLWLILLGVVSRPASLGEVMATLRFVPPSAVTDEPDAALLARLGRRGVPVLERIGLPTAKTRKDLDALGRTVTGHLAEQAAAFTIGLLVPPLFAALLTVGGFHTGWLIPAWLSLVFAALGFVTPILVARTEAVKVRATFRHALSAYLNLVVVCLAGGSGVEEAMSEAGTVGHGAGFALIRHTLQQAQHTRTAPWHALGRLGERVGVVEMTELAASVGLAGRGGARVRDSLKARASAMRARRLADTETQAAAATERMSIPVVAFFAAFLLFLAYPAVVAVVSGL